MNDCIKMLFIRNHNHPPVVILQLFYYIPSAFMRRVSARVTGIIKYLFINNLNMIKRVFPALLILFWLQPSFSQKKHNKNAESGVYITIENKSDADLENSLVEIDMSALPIKLSMKSAGDYILADEKPCAFQVNDINKDCTPDNLSFVCSLKKGEIKEFVLKKNLSGEMPSFKKRTQAELSVKVGGEWKERKYAGGEFKNIKYLMVPSEHTDHSYFIRYEGPGWESDKAAYRFYLDWRNAIDFFGKKVNDMVLQNVGQDGFDSYHEPSEWGMDVLKVGESLGIGTLAMWHGNKANRVAVTDSVSCEILLNGIVESMIETRYYGWKVGDLATDVVSQLSIAAGNHITRHHVTLSSEVDNLCTGIGKDKNAELILDESGQGEWSFLATWGKQSLAGDNLGLAVFYKNSQLEEITGDHLNHVAILKPENKELTYYFLAVWEQEPENIRTKEEFLAYVRSELAKLNHPLSVSIK